MLNPNIGKLIQNYDNRYRLVVDIAHNAREISQHMEEAGEISTEKPVSMAIDKLAQMLEMDFNQEKFSAYFAKKKNDGEDIILLKPTTYMNNSGIALRQCMDFYKVPSEDILVLYDDMDMPVGKLRLRQKGSAGGHNGIKSIISHIGTQEFDRIRIGIGKDKLIPVVDWVLGKFPQEQQEDLNHALEQAAKAAKFSIKHSFSDTMNRYNKK